jgi:phage terminase large subunit GpA-like protein
MIVRNLHVNKKSIFTDAAKRGLTLDPDQYIYEWAAENRFLNSKGSAEPGLWDNDRTPYLKEIMQCLSAKDPTDYVVFVSGTQLGKTEIILNWAGQIIHRMPGPMGIVQSTLPSGETFSKQRLQPMIDSTPVLSGKVASARDREMGNTIVYKEFPGGSINVLTANSEDSLRSKPLRFLALDEVEMYPGWTVAKAIERTETFSNRKIFLCSSPKRLVDSQIWFEFLSGDQRKYFIPCPDCGHMQTMEWKNLKFDYDKKHYNLKGEVLLACINCGSLIPESKKMQMLLDGDWQAQNPEGKYPSFHLPQFYSLLGNSKWRSAVRKFLKCRELKKKGNITHIDLLETWTNDVCAEPWEEVEGQKANWETLFNRREDYKIEPLNENIILLTCGVDIQDDRIECQVLGFGLDYETYVVEYKSFYGKLSDLEIWAHLDEFLLKGYRHANGHKLRIMGAAIDTGGHYANKVYEFTKTRYVKNQRYVFAIKGASTYGQPVVKAPTKIQEAYLFSIGTDTAKDHISECLKTTNPGASYIHFPLSLPEAYFHQLCSERKVKEWFKGKPRHVWKNTSRARNEALDTFVYAIAALNIMQFFLYPNKTVSQMFEEIGQKEFKTLQTKKSNLRTDKSDVQTRVRPRRRVISKGVRF